MPFFLVDVSISVSDFLRPTCSNTMPCLIYFSLFFRGIGDKSEERLLDFFRKVRNLKIESEFWLSLTRSDIEKC